MGRSGTGLGLAIVWGTVKDHNGYIDLRTEIGQGTTFTLYFPVTREELIAQQQKAILVSGFSETVTLGDVGKIKLNPEVVMRVEYQKDGNSYRTKSRVLWRGVTLDRYDGMSWTATADPVWKIDNPLGNGVKLFQSGSFSNTVLSLLMY